MGALLATAFFLSQGRQDQRLRGLITAFLFVFLQQLSWIGFYFWGGAGALVDLGLGVLLQAASLWYVRRVVARTQDPTFRRISQLNNAFMALSVVLQLSRGQEELVFGARVVLQVLYLIGALHLRNSFYDLKFQVVNSISQILWVLYLISVYCREVNERLIESETRESLLSGALGNLDGYQTQFKDLSQILRLEEISIFFLEALKVSILLGNSLFASCFDERLGHQDRKNQKSVKYSNYEFIEL